MAGSLSGFNIGVGGLRASSGAIDTASTNISNANTVGYKAGEYQFVDQFFRAISSTEVGRAGQGASAASVRRQFSQGAVRTTSSSLDLAINGTGFFRLSSKNGSDPGLVYYTRNGQLSADKDGYVVNATGLYLMGHPPNARGDGVSNDIGALKLPPSQKPPAKTEEATLFVNIDARGEIKRNADGVTLKNFDPNDDTSFSHATTFSVYDATGNKHAVKVYYRRVDDIQTAQFQGDNGAPTQQTAQAYKLYMSVTDIDGNLSWVKEKTVGDQTVYETVPAPRENEEAKDGEEAFPVGGADTATDAYALGITNSLEEYADKTDNGLDDPAFVSTSKILAFFEGQNTNSIDRNSKGESVEKTTFTFSIRKGNSTQAIKLDLSDTTRYSSDFEVKDLKQDGYPIGALNSVSFDENGMLFGIYSNGQRLIAGQAVLAQFKSPEGLSPIAQNLFAQTVSSGEALLGVPGSGSFGVVRSNGLEEANIDMASELVNLMIQQRNYQANSESIRAQDEILKSTISLAR